ncbi:electron transport complex subunit RsxG [Agitococcus lubricus]|uniref:Ion-translocating oxidoreductase complex subunit G n=1 Tax=Agitococcus lubricus TaxID=1077255 RepID=A0A2T5IVF8_9GAMM|nr:electron transport complex subunit RsxG [Agitococcus lubricus]PTQ87867.1 electron transport complex protein RnfG [Agitococcus lubricus]
MNASIRQNARVLAVFALLCTGLIAGVYALSKNKIAASQQIQLMDSLNTLIPASNYDNDLLHDTRLIDNQTLLHLEKPSLVYRARKNGQPIGVIFPVVSPDGYSGKIHLLVAVANNGQLLGVKVLSHKETPGLGDAIESEKSDWITQFTSKSLANPVAAHWAVKKDGGQFDQFTGATITPRAVVAAVKNALLYYQLHQQTLFD